MFFFVKGDNYMARGLQEFLYLSFCYIRTKTLYPKARLIRFPFDIRGKQGINLGKNLTTGRGCRLESFSKNKTCSLIFGDNVQINDYVHINALEKVVIGNNVLIASKVFITDLEHGSYKGDMEDSNPESRVVERTLSSRSVQIEDNVWIGELVSVLPGVTIGCNSIIGANSVVTKSIPKNCIAVGNPAKVIKKFNYNTNNWERV